MAAQNRDHRWMRGNPYRPDLTADAPEQGPRFERRAAGRQLEQRRMSPRADELQKTESIDRVPFERLGENFIDRRRSGLAGILVPGRGQVDSDRTADAVTANGPA